MTILTEDTIHLLDIVFTITGLTIEEDTTITETADATFTDPEVEFTIKMEELL